VAWFGDAHHKKREVEVFAYVELTQRQLQAPGLLLVCADGAGKPNAMTIGWGFIGFIWNWPMFVVPVRPQRYTHGLIEARGDFTVNVMPANLAEVVSYCGSVSGREHDKFAERGLTAEPGARVSSPRIAEAMIQYECQVVYKDDVKLDLLDPEAAKACYPGGDWHRLFFGRILAVHAEEVKSK